MELFEVILVINLLWNVLLTGGLILLFAKMTYLKYLIKAMNPEKVLKKILENKIPVIVDENGRPVMNGTPPSITPVHNPITG